MTIDWLTGRDWRKARLFGPIIALTLGVLTLLVLTSGLLIQRFDATAKLREAHMVDHGFAQQIAELDKVVATQVGWDDAILSLDHKRDAGWADFNIGNYLYTFNGFTHSFVIDSGESVFYASVNGERAGLEAYASFAPIAAQLIPEIRAAERRRPPLRHRPGNGNIVVPPIQADTVSLIDGQVFLVGATLVQPDFGHVLPKGARAPIAITAIPIGSRLLDQFSQRYLLDGVRLVTGTDARPGPGLLVLADRAGQPVAALEVESAQTQFGPVRRIAAAAAGGAGAGLRRGAYHHAPQWSGGERPDCQ
jgi:sensor domain CHASE-containing protein